MSGLQVSGAGNMADLTAEAYKAWSTRARPVGHELDPNDPRDQPILAEMARKKEAQAAYEKARAQQILDINGTKGRSETILSDVFNNTPSGIATGVLK